MGRDYKLMVDMNQTDLEADTTQTALGNLFTSISKEKPSYLERLPVFLDLVARDPRHALRDVYLMFHDAVAIHYVPPGVDEYPHDPESINFIYYDFNKLFVEGCDQIFVIDRLLGNRFMNHVDGFGDGTRKKNMITWEGPPGSGKSTFLDILLKKIENYTHLPEGRIYDTVWQLDMKKLFTEEELKDLRDLEARVDENSQNEDKHGTAREGPRTPIKIPEDYLVVPCLDHDLPILQIPKLYRRDFLDDLIKDKEFKKALFNEKQYDWVFQRQPCTFCTTMYKAILERLERVGKTNPLDDLFNMILARQHIFSKQFGDGISVFNPGDPDPKETVTNPVLEMILNAIFKENPHIEYKSSYLANTNNGIYALMDLKELNKERLLRLRNVLSDAVRKVKGTYEQYVKTVFLAVANPEDWKVLKDDRALMERITLDSINFALDYHAEVSILRTMVSNDLDKFMLPEVIENFAKVMISTRMNKGNEVMHEWIEDAGKYMEYTDPGLFLLKMEIYTGNIPIWLDETDLKAFNSRRRKNIINSSIEEGNFGIGPRISKNLFVEFTSTYRKEGSLITMGNLADFVAKREESTCKDIPEKFLDFLLRSYNSTVLEQVKDALFERNEEEISKIVQNYIFATNYDLGTKQKCEFTGDKLEITEDFFKRVEKIILGERSNAYARKEYRDQVFHDYTTHCLSVEMQVEGTELSETTLYKRVNESYIAGRRESALEPFRKNINFRSAIIDYNKKQKFKTYDKRIKKAVRFMIQSLQEKYEYSEKGARQIAIYVYDYVLNPPKDKSKTAGGRR